MNAITTHPDTPTWLLLHGLLCDADTWRDFVGPLSRSAPVLAANFSNIKTFHEAAQDVLGRVNGPVVIIGHSMGGRIAFEMLRQAPGRIRGAVLMNTGCTALGPGELPKRQAILQAAQTGGIAAILDDWLSGMIAPATRDDPALMQRMRDMVLRSSAASFTSQIRALIARPDASALLPQITCPVLLMSGTEDRWSPLPRHEDMARHIQGAEVAAIQGAGHMAPFERPAACLDAIMDWARRHGLPA